MSAFTHAIPTRHPEPLPKGRSYPVGAKILSESLGSVAVFGQLRLWFLNDGGLLDLTTTHGNRRHKLKNSAGVDLRRFQRLLSVRTPSKPNGIGVWDNFGDEWQMRIHSVASSQKKTAGEVLHRFALPLVHDWLTTDRPPSWYLDSRTLTIGATEDGDECCFIETCRDRMEWFKVCDDI